MLFLFWVKHFPPAKYKEAILYPVSRKGVNEHVRETTVDRADANNVAPDRHVLADVVDISEHNLS